MVERNGIEWYGGIWEEKEIFNFKGGERQISLICFLEEMRCIHVLAIYTIFWVDGKRDLLLCSIVLFFSLNVWACVRVFMCVCVCERERARAP